MCVCLGAVIKLKAELEKHHDAMVTVRPLDDKMVRICTCAHFCEMLVYVPLLPRNVCIVAIHIQCGRI